MYVEVGWANKSCVYGRMGGSVTIVYVEVGWVHDSRVFGRVEGPVNVVFMLFLLQQKWRTL